MTKEFYVKDEHKPLLLKLEQLQYDATAHINVLGYLISSENIHSDAFNEYQTEYMTINAEYEKTKAQFEAEVIQPEMSNEKTSYNWSVSFYTGLVTIKC